MKLTTKTMTVIATTFRYTAWHPCKEDVGSYDVIYLSITPADIVIAPAGTTGAAGVCMSVRFYGGGPRRKSRILVSWRQRRLFLRSAAT